ncbi:L,D-transpeptidase family protein [Aquisalinus flavus]|nr:L,D-transpeptidase family protein [Aquisalinus flavus]MBD0425580.1 L,D-transpeptidase family protein [Aquisalinus flavus]UNE48797.1 L,D-transpeptidase family protein [Aquisalinus flavus]
MQLKVTARKSEPRGIISVRDTQFDCALGPAGLVRRKKEGDGGTPLATMPLLQVYFRPDHVERPQTRLRTIPLLPNMGWCDDPSSPAYNRLVHLPFDGSHEKMWRDDHAYDICVVLGWNYDKPRPGEGSAIFFHLAKENYSPTEGCIAVSLDAMLGILKHCGTGSEIHTLIVH